MEPTTLTCQACGNPSRDGGLCDPCEKILADTLAWAPDLLDELLVQTTRQSVTSAGGRGSDTPLPINLRASKLSSDYEKLLLGWARSIATYGDPSLPANGKQAAHWLAERIYDIRMLDIAGQITDQLTHHADACWSAIDREGADLIYLGVCKALLPPLDEECRSALRARKGNPTATCWRCEATYNVAEMLAIRDAVIDRSLATAAEIANAGFKTPDGRTITLQMIRGYIARHVIIAKGMKRNDTLNRDAALYSIADVKQAALSAKYPKTHTSSANTKLSA